MTGESTLDLKSGARPDWTVVDEGWGRKAADIVTLSEPGNCREYIAMYHRLGVGEGDRLLDVACGAGLAIALALVHGAGVAASMPRPGSPRWHETGTRTPTSG